MVHVSAIGADPHSDSLYARSKALGEAKVLAAQPRAVVLRPSLVFGPGDSFFNRFASLARVLPVLPLAGAETRFQPVFVGDVAEAVARAVDGQAEAGRVYELGGPEVETLDGLVRYMLKTTPPPRLVVDLPKPIAMLQARVIETVDTLSLGLLPDSLKLTRDQVTLLQTDNVVSEAAKAGRPHAGRARHPAHRDGRHRARLPLDLPQGGPVLEGGLHRFRGGGRRAVLPAGRPAERSPDRPRCGRPEPDGRALGHAGIVRRLEWRRENG